jgi:hypothetical protein
MHTVRMELQPRAASYSTSSRQRAPSAVGLRTLPCLRLLRPEIIFAIGSLCGMFVCFCVCTQFTQELLAKLEVAEKERDLAELDASELATKLMAAQAEVKHARTRTACEAACRLCLDLRALLPCRLRVARLTQSGSLLCDNDANAQTGWCSTCGAQWLSTDAVPERCLFLCAARIASASKFNRRKVLLGGGGGGGGGGGREENPPCYHALFAEWQH